MSDRKEEKGSTTTYNITLLRGNRIPSAYRFFYEFHFTAVGAAQSTITMSTTFVDINRATATAWINIQWVENQSHSSFQNGDECSKIWIGENTQITKCEVG